MQCLMRTGNQPLIHSITENRREGESPPFFIHAQSLYRTFRYAGEKNKKFFDKIVTFRQGILYC